MEVPGVDNTPLVRMYEDAAPKARGNRRKLHGSSPSLLWNKNGPEMTCLATIADLKVHEEAMQARAKDTAERKTKTFVDKVLLTSVLNTDPPIHTHKHHMHTTHNTHI